MWPKPMDFWKFDCIAQTEALHWLFGKDFPHLGLFQSPLLEKSGKRNNKFDDLGLCFVGFVFLVCVFD